MIGGRRSFKLLTPEQHQLVGVELRRTLLALSVIEANLTLAYRHEHHARIAAGQAVREVRSLLAHLEETARMDHPGTAVSADSYHLGDREGEITVDELCKAMGFPPLYGRRRGLVMGGD